MGEAKQKKQVTIEDIKADIRNDLQLEQEWNDMLGKKRPELVKSEMEQAVFVLNEQQEAMLRYRFDLGTFVELATLEPWNKEWVEKIQETVFILKSRRVTLKALRLQIVEMIANGQK